MLKSLFKLFATLGKESLTETRVRLYKQMKTKTFQFIPPHEKSMLQAIRYDVFYESRVDEAIISDILLQGNATKLNFYKFNATFL